MTQEEPSTQKLDTRHPLYLGHWTRSIPGIDKDTRIDKCDEPHLKRKATIMQKYPEIINYSGYDIITLYITLAAVSAQILSAYYFGNIFSGSNLMFVFFSYAIGATISAMFSGIFHEVSHNAVLETILQNRFVGLLANIPMLVPIGMSFKRYHLEHHSYQGVRGYDPDLPMEWEVKLIHNNPLSKVLWLMMYSVMYVVRGLALNKPMRKWEAINIVWTIMCDVALYFVVGPKGMLYLLLSVFFGYGLHYGAAHFIQEHYTFADGQETYDYYGSGNLLYMNIGYHNEHHDFLSVPWTKLPAVKNMADEFYSSLNYHTSWWKVIYMFITCSILAPQSRVERNYDDFIAYRKKFKINPEPVPDNLKPGVDLSTIKEKLDNEYRKLMSNN
ncbi:Sphingolipid delta(4)-desaturase DES1 [Zancudomyces culisetae]|uniref:Sphingolipid delta(4)-desaturase DES1 n=1 Tax=Zancudomyces culisetae TaxID=1213189 RepID=A0A1R1PS17_ZANCU|nr:Sphingolipid delta(4)-desaturase DES1 [Zancudomyces culisetae]|eukprot:OMH83683.1 Sphingolipid delta(4)-desaturase DES1 [Zancudomyces culisetae]